MINLIDKCVTLQGYANGCEVKKKNKDKSWNKQLQYIGERIICRRAIEEKKYEKFFTPPKSPGKSPSSSCDANIMLDLKEHCASNFKMWSLIENKIRK
jgi:hypothetical protein